MNIRPCRTLEEEGNNSKWRLMALRRATSHLHCPLPFPARTLVASNTLSYITYPTTMAHKPKKKNMLIEQEIKFAKMLAGNDKIKRARMLKKLRTWISVRAKKSLAFTELDFMRLWKGLFYCMWMSDKPLIQEELAESISQLVQCFESKDLVLLYTTCALKTLAWEWFGIDYWRMDKFQMLVRRIVRQTFVVCKKQLWDEEWIKEIAAMIESLLLDPKGGIGFKFHLTEIYMEELAKISEGNIPEERVTDLVKPFAVYLATISDERVIKNVMKFIFRHLIVQSDVGLDYKEKFDAWRRAGFPKGNIDAMQKIELSDEESDCEDNEEELNNSVENSNIDKPLDPRHGRVDVELPQIPFNPCEIANLMKEFKFHPESTAKNRRQIRRLIKEFEILADGKMPIGVQEVMVPDRKAAKTNPKVAALKLLEFEDELYADTKRRLKRKKLLEKFNSKETTTDDNPDEETAVKKQKIAAKKVKKEKKSLNEKITKKKLKKNKNLVVEPSLSNGLSEEKSVEINTKLPPAENNLELDDTPDKKTAKELPKLDTTSVKDRTKNKLMKIKKKQGLKSSISEEKKVLKDLKKKIKNKLQPGSNVKKSTALALSLSDCIPWKVSDMSSNSKSKIKTLKKSLSKKENVSEIPPIDKIPWLRPVLKKLEDEQVLSASNASTPRASSATKKRVQIVLQKNTAQHTSEYIRQLRLSPAIPFDANKKPLVGVLKPSPISSPINPFYKKL